MAHKTYESVESEEAFSALTEHYGTGSGLYKMWASPVSVLRSIVLGWGRSPHPAQLHYGWDLERAACLDEAIRLTTRKAIELLHLDGVQNPRIFEPGCGIGGAATQAGQMLPDGKISGMSLVARQLAIARERTRALGLSNVEYFLGNYLSTPFPDGFFDGIFAIEALCYTPMAERPRLFREMFRILKPSRRLVVIDGCSLRPPRNDTERRWVKDVLDGWTMPLPATPEEFKAGAEAAGFRLLRQENVTGHAYASARRIAQIARHGLVPLSFLARLPGGSRLLEPLGFASPTGAGRFIDACRSQIKVFDAGLGAYYLHVFEKP